MEPKEKIVFQLPRCTKDNIFVLGVLKAGVAYIPIDPEISAKRENYIMETHLIYSDMNRDDIAAFLPANQIFIGAPAQKP